MIQYDKILSQNLFLIQVFKTKKNSRGKGLGVSCIKTFFCKITYNLTLPLCCYIKIEPTFLFFLLRRENRKVGINVHMLHPVAVLCL